MLLHLEDRAHESPTAQPLQRRSGRRNVTVALQMPAFSRFFDLRAQTT